MAIENIIAGGIGFSPGSISYIPTLGFNIGAVAVSHTPLKYTTFELADGLGVTLAPVGNTIPLTLIDAIPIQAPSGNKGVCFLIVGGVVKTYAWNGSSWVSN